MGTQDERLPWVEQIHSKNLSACYAIPWVQMSNKLKNKVNADNTFGTLMKNISTFKDRLIFIIKMLVFEEIEQWLKYEVFPTPYSIFLVDCCESSLLLFVRRHWQEIHEILSSIKYSSILSFPCGETTQNLSYLPSILLLGTNKNSRSSTACLVWISFRKMHTMHRFARGTRNGIFRPTEPQTKGAYPETHSRFSCPATNVGPAGHSESGSHRSRIRMPCPRSRRGRAMRPPNQKPAIHKSWTTPQRMKYKKLDPIRLNPTRPGSLNLSSQTCGIFLWSINRDYSFCYCIGVNPSAKFRFEASILIYK